MKLCLITSNKGKLAEFRSALAPLDIEVDHSAEGCDEIQADTLQEVVHSCLTQLKTRGFSNFAIDDSGLFIHALKGFPGVYSAYVMRTLGNQGILTLLEGVEDRSAHFECCIGCSWHGEEFTAIERCEGTIARRPAGTGGFGFDPIFIPSGHSTTFAEMSLELKNNISHRGRAIRAFSEELRRRSDGA